MKVATVVGARPQFIKAAAVSRALRPRHEELLIHTGQHYDANMSEVFFEQLQIPRPDVNLGVGSGSHAQQTAAMLTGIEEVLLRERPDAVLVHGDTNTTLAGALAAAKLRVPVAHVEAGLRSGDRSMPEEVNRIVVDHAADLLLCPTQHAMDTLAQEGLGQRSRLVGDVMLDVFNWARDAARRQPLADPLRALPEGGFWLATVHRASNTDDPARLRSILDGLAAIGEPVLLPLHPRTRAAASRHGLEGALRRLHVVDPLPYLDNVQALSLCKGVLTDSGGLQKEAYYAGRRCVTLRDTTEWKETCHGGWNVLAGWDAKAIAAAAKAPAPTAARAPSYGDGRAAEKVVQHVAGLVG